MISPSLYPLISRYLPQNIRESYPLFVTFMQAYYRWLSEKGRPRWGIASLNLTDLNSVDPEFYQYFSNEYLQGIPVSATYIPSLIKVIKQFYRAKGSSASFDFIFNLLGDPTANTVSLASLQPVTDTQWQIIVPSAGSISDTFLMNQSGKIIRGVSSGAWGKLESSSSDGSYITLILSDVHGVFQAGELLAPNSGIAFVPNYVLQSQLVGFTITDGGAGYAYSDTVNVLDANQSADISIGRLGSMGNIVEFQINAGGVGYASAPSITVSSRYGFGLSATGILGGASRLDTFSNDYNALLTYVILTTLDSSTYAPVMNLIQPAGIMLAGINKNDAGEISETVSAGSTLQPYAGIHCYEFISSESGTSIPEALAVQQPVVRYAILGALSWNEMTVEEWNGLSIAGWNSTTVDGDGLNIADVITCGNAVGVSSSSSTNKAFVSYEGILVGKVGQEIISFADRPLFGYGTTNDGDAVKYLIVEITEDASGNLLSQSSKTIHTIYGMN